MAKKAESKYKFTLGTDPEFFLYNFRTSRFESAHEVIPGTKKEPYKLKGGACQLDGTAVEFNTDPAATPEEFATNIEGVLKQIREIVPKHYGFHFSPTVHYDKDYFDSLPEKVLELGCDPDFDAMSGGQQNPIPKPVGTMRTGSGHIHVGWTNGKSIVDDTYHMLDCELVVKEMQRSIGAYLASMDEYSERSRMYGKPYAFRYKPYGVEYRTPSNAWLNYPDNWLWMFERVTRDLQSLSQYGSGHSDMIKEVVINYGLVAKNPTPSEFYAAQLLLKRNKQFAVKEKYAFTDRKVAFS